MKNIPPLDALMHGTKAVRGLNVTKHDVLMLNENGTGGLKVIDDFVTGNVGPGNKPPELKFSFLVPALRAPEFKILPPGRFKWPAGCSLSDEERLVAKNKWSFHYII
jgi:hypothetical protein